MGSAEPMGFLDGYFLWRDPLLAATALAVACGYLGIYVILKRVVFMVAALGQVASVGVATTFLVADLLGLAVGHAHQGPVWLNPMAVALAFVVVTAVVLSAPASYRRLTPESVVGLAYLAAAAAVVLIAHRIPQGAHDIDDILFGSAVAVEGSQLAVVLGLVAVLAVVHLVLFKEFVFVSFDAGMAATLGLPTRRLNAALFVGIGVLIAAATRTVGALPVFAFLVLPPLGALLATRRLKSAFVASTLLAALAAVLGYYLSWVGDLPTGATMVAVAVGLLPGCALLGRLRRH